MLNGKQKRYLRALANKERAVFQIGKDGLSYNLYSAVGDYLKANELVKISLLKTYGGDVREAAFDLSSATSSEIVQIIGRVIVLYKKAKEPKIMLP